MVSLQSDYGALVCSYLRPYIDLEGSITDKNVWQQNRTKVKQNMTSEKIQRWQLSFYWLINLNSMSTFVELFYF